MGYRKLKKALAFILTVAMMFTVLPAGLLVGSELDLLGDTELLEADKNEQVTASAAQELLGQAEQYYSSTRNKTLENFWDLGAYIGAWGSPDSSYSVPDYTEAFSAALPTDYAGRILGMLAEELDPQTANDQDLLADLVALQKDDGTFGPRFLANQQIWAIIALNAVNTAGTDSSQYAQYDKSKAVTRLLAAQTDQGAIGSIDETAMALIALAASQDVGPAVAAAVIKAVDYLKSQQQTADNLAGGWSDNASTIATVISGLASVGEDVESSDWAVSGQSPIDVLGSFRTDDGGFKNKLSDTASNRIASYQSIIALGDVLRGGSIWYCLEPLIPDDSDQEDETVDKTALLAAIENAAKIQQGSYTNDSFTKLTEALASALAAANDPSAANADVIAALSALETAVNGLKASGSSSGGSQISATIRITGLSGKVILDTKTSTFSFDDGKTALDLFCEAADKYGITYDLRSGYIAGVNGLSEFDRGPNSGWLYTVNGVKVDVGADGYTLESGDKIIFYYTLDWTKESGSGNWSGGGGSGGGGSSGGGSSGGGSSSSGSNNSSSALLQLTDNLVSPNAAAKTDLGSVNSQIASIAAHYQQQSELSNWESLALVLAGQSLPSGVIEQMIQKVADSGGVFNAPTEAARLALTLQLSGRDLRDIGGVDLLAAICNSPDIGKQGVNGYIFSLLVLNNYIALPADSPTMGAIAPKRFFTVMGSAATAQIDPKAVADSFVAEIISYQNSDGGFPLAKGGVSDPDLTAMALQSLAPYRQQTQTKYVINEALVYLQSNLGSDGFYTSGGVSGAKSSETIAQVIIALCSLNLNPDAEQFVREERGLMETLLRFRTNDGRFSHLMGGEATDMSTEQAALAMEAYTRFFAGRPPLYSIRNFSAPVDAAQNAVSVTLALVGKSYTQADCVILTASEESHLIDSLLAGSLAGELKAPLLATYHDRLDSAVKARILELQATKVIAVGAITDSVTAELLEAGLNVEIIRGSDRWQTAGLINARLTAPEGTFIVGWNALPDIVSIAPYAAAKGYALILADPSGQIPIGQKVLGSKIYLLGGQDLTNDLPEATRLGGANRYETNRLILEALSFDFSRVYVAAGSNDQISLCMTVGPCAGLTGAPLILIEGSTSDFNALSLPSRFPGQITGEPELTIVAP